MAGDENGVGTVAGSTPVGGRLVGLYCGLRKNELLRLHVADVNMPKQMMRVVPRTTSGRLKTSSSEKPVPIADALVPDIEEWLSIDLIPLHLEASSTRRNSVDVSCRETEGPVESGAPGGKPSTDSRPSGQELESSI